MLKVAHLSSTTAYIDKTKDIDTLKETGVSVVLEDVIFGLQALGHVYGMWTLENIDKDTYAP